MYGSMKRMVLNDNDQNDENNESSNALSATTSNNDHQTQKSVAKPATKKRNAKGNNARKRRRSTSSTILEPNIGNDVVDLSSSSSPSSSNDCNVSIPSLQTQSMDGTMTMENVATTSNSNGDATSHSMSTNTGSSSRESQQLFPSLENENDDVKGMTFVDDSIHQQIHHETTTSSLFGNVMKNVTASSVGMTASSISSATTAAALQLPSATPTALSNDPMTPARALQRTPKGGGGSAGKSNTNENHSAKRSLTKQNKLFAMNSPGGFQLLDFVNGFGNSPLFHKFKSSTKTTHRQQRTPDPLGRKKASAVHTTIPHTPRNTTTPSRSDNDGILETCPLPPSIPATPRHDVEWHECVVQNKQMYWIDWSIKSTIELQYQPSKVLDAFLLSQDCPNPQIITQYKQSAMQQFVVGDGGTLDITTPNDATAAVDFYAALCYWQHPAIHPLPDELLLRRPNHHVSSAKSNTSVPTELLSSYSTTGSNSRLAMPPPQKHMRVFTTTSTTSTSDTNQQNTNESLLQARISEWQDAFQSLYLGWLNKIRLLNQQWSEISCNSNSDAAFDNFYRQISETYFYAIGKGHTILFRVGVIHDTNKGQSDSSSAALQLQLQPEIILSSSSKSLRQKLRSMNVTLYLLYEWNCLTGVFEDEYLYGSASGLNPKAADAAATSSPNVMAELIALRRQQMTRWRVGPDIAVMMKPKSLLQNQYTPSPKSVPPLRITGLEQCSSFFDVYYHSLGQMGTTNYVENYHVRNLTVDVPILLCRKLGPFLHATIKSNDANKNEMPMGTNRKSTNTTLDMHGYFLPCAVRDLTCAVVDAMQVAKTNSQFKIGPEIESDDRKDGNDASSCHFVMQSTVHQGDELKNVSGLGAIGSHCSKRLNGSWKLIDTMNEQVETQYCHQDEVLRLAVWDESRPTALAIKLHHMPTFL